MHFILVQKKEKINFIPMEDENKDFNSTGSCPS